MIELFKRWSGLLLLALVCACSRGGGCAGRREERPGGPPPAPQAGAPADSTGHGKGSQPPQLTPLLPPGSETAGTVVRVRDGDSLVVQRSGAEVEIRLEGVDCPELDQEFGGEAKKFTTDLALGKAVRLIGKGKDSYGRELAVVFLPDRRSLNRELIATGNAWWYRKYSKDRTLEFLEQIARNERRGLWQAPNPVPPWEFREAARDAGQARSR